MLSTFTNILTDASATTLGTTTTRNSTASQRLIASALMTISRRTYIMSAPSTLVSSTLGKVLPAAKSRTLTTMLYAPSVGCKWAEGISSGIEEGDGERAERWISLHSAMATTEELCSSNLISFLCLSIHSRKKVELSSFHTPTVPQLCSWCDTVSSVMPYPTRPGNFK